MQTRLAEIILRVDPSLVGADSWRWDSHWPWLLLLATSLLGKYMLDKNTMGYS